MKCAPNLICNLDVSEEQYTPDSVMEIENIGKEVVGSTDDAACGTGAGLRFLESSTSSHRPPL